MRTKNVNYSQAVIVGMAFAFPYAFKVGHVYNLKF